MGEHEGISHEYEGMMQNLRSAFLELTTPAERVKYVIWAQTQRDLVESVPEDRAYEDFVKWSFGDLTSEETALLKAELGKKNNEAATS